jgi:hypothetical protein
MKFTLVLTAILTILAMSNIAFAQYCVPGWQNSYECDGNWQRQLYVNPDCSPYWSYIQYCSNGCSSGQCSGVTQYTSACSVSASLTTPTSIQSGELASTTILFTNNGDTGGTVNVNAVLCNADSSNCFSISCSSSQVFVPAHSIAYDVCSTRNYYGYYGTNPNYNPNYYPYNYPYNNPSNYPNYYPYNYYQGWFRIRVDMNGCNLATSLYTPQFQIQPYQYCTPGNTNNYQCSGITRQVQYQFGDCRTEWRYYDTCANGCSSGVCLAATATTTVSTATTTVTAQPQYVLPDLTTLVIILGIIVLLIIFLMLLTDGRWERRHYHTYHDEAEHASFSERLAGVTKSFSKFNLRKSSVC